MHFGQPVAHQRVLGLTGVFGVRDRVTEQGIIAEQALNPAPLVIELGGDLIPAPVLLADQPLVGHLHIIKEHLVEVVLASDIDQRPHLNSGRLHVNHELADALVLWRVGIGAGHQIGVVGHMGKTGPDLLTAEREVIPLFDRLGAQRGQVGARTGLAHAQTEHDFAPGHAGQDGGFLLLAAVGQQRRSNLSVAEPVGGNRRPGPQEFLGQDQAIQIGFFLAAILFGPGQSDPAPGAELVRKFP